MGLSQTCRPGRHVHVAPSFSGLPKPAAKPKSRILTRSPEAMGSRRTVPCKPSCLPEAGASAVCPGSGPHRSHKRVCCFRRATNTSEQWRWAASRDVSAARWLSGDWVWRRQKRSGDRGRGDKKRKPEPGTEHAATRTRKHRRVRGQRGNLSPGWTHVARTGHPWGPRNPSLSRHHWFPANS